MSKQLNEKERESIGDGNCSYVSDDDWGCAGGKGVLVVKMKMVGGNVW